MRALWLLLVLATSGCGTLVALYDGLGDDAPTGYYRGTAIDLALIEDIPWYYDLFIIVDLPFSLVGDTLALPIYAMTGVTRDTSAMALVRRAIDSELDGRRRVDAIDGLATVDPPPAPGEGGQLLGLVSGDPPLREALARVLPVLDLPATELAPALKRLLADGDVEVRRAAALAWVTSHPRYESGLPSALRAALQSAAEDDDEDVRDYVAEALGG